MANFVSLNFACIKNNMQRARRALAEREGGKQSAREEKM